MAKDFDDCEFWLPPRFLTDDDDPFTEFKSQKNGAKNGGLSFARDYQRDISYGFSGFGPNSDLSSPVDGSTETQSDEEDFITELTRNFSYSTLRDAGLSYENRKQRWGLSRSPQSTLCSLGGCDCNHGSSRGSPNRPSRVSSPLEVSRPDEAWALLYAAAGEVAQLRTNEAGIGFHSKNNGTFGPPRNPSPITVPLRNPSPNLAFHPSQPQLPSRHFKAVQFEQLKKQQLVKQQGSYVWGQEKYQLSHNQQMLQSRGRIGKANLPITAWPTLEQSSQRQQLQSQPQKPGSGMRAVFLGNSGSKRECAGTGVFLPRRFETPKKSGGCSTVLLPDRVVQALKLNLGSEDSQMPNRYNESVAPDYYADVSKERNGMVIPQEQKRSSTVRTQQAVLSPEVRRLPQEWTY